MLDKRRGRLPSYQYKYVSNIGAIAIAPYEIYIHRFNIHTNFLTPEIVYMHSHGDRGNEVGGIQ